MKMENVWTLLCLLHCICAADAAREHIVRGSSPLFPLFSSFRGAAIIHQPVVTGPQEKNNKKKRDGGGGGQVRWIIVL